MLTQAAVVVLAHHWQYVSTSADCLPWKQQVLPYVARQTTPGAAKHPYNP